MNSYLGHSNIIPSTPFIVSYNLSAAHHTSPVPEYIIMSYRPKTAVLMSAILFTACCTRTAVSVLIFFRFYLCLTAVCLLFSIKTIIGVVSSEAILPILPKNAIGCTIEGTLRGFKRAFKFAWANNIYTKISHFTSPRQRVTRQSYYVGTVNMITWAYP